MILYPNIFGVAEAVFSKSCPFEDDEGHSDQNITRSKMNQPFISIELLDSSPTPKKKRKKGLTKKQLADLLAVDSGSDDSSLSFENGKTGITQISLAGRNPVDFYSSVREAKNQSDIPIMKTISSEKNNAQAEANAEANFVSLDPEKDALIFDQMPLSSAKEQIHAETGRSENKYLAIDDEILMESKKMNEVSTSPAPVIEDPLADRCPRDAMKRPQYTHTDDHKAALEYLFDDEERRMSIDGEDTRSKEGSPTLPNRKEATKRKIKIGSGEIPVKKQLDVYSVHGSYKELDLKEGESGELVDLTHIGGPQSRDIPQYVPTWAKPDLRSTKTTLPPSSQSKTPQTTPSISMLQPSEISTESITTETVTELDEVPHCKIEEEPEENHEHAVFRAFNWYARMGQPSRDTMRKRIAANPGEFQGTVADDVDLLPWNSTGIMIAVRDMNALRMANATTDSAKRKEVTRKLLTKYKKNAFDEGDNLGQHPLSTGSADIKPEPEPSYAVIPPSEQRYTLKPDPFELQESESEYEDIEEPEEVQESALLKAFIWYARMGQPQRENMRQRIALKPSDFLGTVADDVDLLPWNKMGTMISVNDMNKLILANDTKTDNIKRKQVAQELLQKSKKKKIRRVKRQIK
jgi:hypothetical protein